MDRVKIVEQAILSVDEAYMKARYQGKVYVPTGVLHGSLLTPRYKEKVRRICGYGYPGGEIAAVIDQTILNSFSKGYLFTEEGFYATKGNLAESAGSKKQAVSTIIYAEIVSVELVTKNKEPLYLRIDIGDEEYTCYVGIFAPYLYEVLQKIRADLWPKKKKEKPAEKQPVKDTPVEEKPAPKEDAPATDDPFELGRRAYEEERYVEALALFRLSASRGEVEAYYVVASLMGMLAKTTRDYAEALTFLKKYQQLGGKTEIRDLADDLFRDYYMEVARDAMKQEQWEQGEEALRKAVKYENYEATLLLAKFLSSYKHTQESLEEALALAKKVAEKFPDMEEAQEEIRRITGKQKMEQAFAAVEEKKGEEAYALAKEAAQRGVVTPLVSQLALVFGETRQDYLDALAYLEQCSNVVNLEDEEYKTLRRDLQKKLFCLEGLEAMEQKRFREAEASFRKAVQLGDIEAIEQLVFALMCKNTLKDMQEALTYAEKYRESSPGEKAEALVKMVQGHIALQEGHEAREQGDIPKAMQCYQKAGQLGRSRGYYCIALMLMENAKTEQDILEATSWGKRYAQCDECPDAEEILEELETLRYCFAGEDAKKKKHWGEAISLFLKAVRRGNAGAMKSLACLLALHGTTQAQWDDALMWAKKYRQLCPEDGEELEMHIQLSILGKNL